MLYYDYKTYSNNHSYKVLAAFIYLQKNLNNKSILYLIVYNTMKQTIEENVFFISRKNFNEKEDYNYIKKSTNLQ